MTLLLLLSGLPRESPVSRPHHCRKENKIEQSSEKVGLDLKTFEDSRPQRMKTIKLCDREQLRRRIWP